VTSEEARVGDDYHAISRCTPEDAARAVESGEDIITVLKQLLPPGIVWAIARSTMRLGQLVHLFGTRPPARGR